MSTKTLAALGDSQTDLAAGYKVRPSDTWAPILGTLLNNEGASTRMRTFGIAGDTSATLLARSNVAHMYDLPEVVLIAIGVNDPVGSLTSAQTITTEGAIIKGLKHGAYGTSDPSVPGNCSVADQTALPATGRPGQRYVVLNDTSTTGGMPAVSTGQATTITGSVTADANSNKITVWEFRYPQVGERGWGRVATNATAPTFTKKFVVIDPPYRNWTTGGDTTSVESSPNAALRTALQSVVTVENQTVGGVPSVIYAGLYNFMKARIVAGKDPDFSSVAFDQTKNWHYIQNNQHYSAYGHALQAQAVLSAMKTQAPAWIGALS